jgi:hypothetical protein
VLRALFLTTTADLETAAVALETLTQFNAIHLARHEEPPLYRSGVVYVPPAECVSFCEQEWLTIPFVKHRGRGACLVLAPWRAAELRKSGHAQAVAFPIIVPSAPPPFPTQMHAIVTRDGTIDGIEDPSARLGMPPMPRDQLLALARSHLRYLSPRCSSWR